MPLCIQKLFRLESFRSMTMVNILACKAIRAASSRSCVGSVLSLAVAMRMFVVVRACARISYARNANVSYWMFHSFPFISVHFIGVHCENFASRQFAFIWRFSLENTNMNSHRSVWQWRWWMLYEYAATVNVRALSQLKPEQSRDSVNWLWMRVVWFNSSSLRFIMRLNVLCLAFEMVMFFRFRSMDGLTMTAMFMANG